MDWFARCGRVPLVALAVVAGAVLSRPAWSGAECANAPEGLVAWYRAERNADDAAGVFNGSLTGASLYVAGAVGEAFRFPGAVTDSMGTSALPAEQRALRESFSIELWARPERSLGSCPESNSSNCSGANLAWAIFPAHGDSAAPPEEFGVSAGIGIALGTDGVCVGEHAAFLVDCLARAAVAIDDWTHVVAVVENRTPRIYVDGVLARVGVASAKSFVFASWGIIGNGSTLGQYQGDLDEVSIYDRALADSEIAALAAAGSAGKCPRACPRERDDDSWNGATVVSSSALLSSSPDGAFGAADVSPEATSLLFADAQPDGTVHSIEWETDEPFDLVGFGLAAFHDAFGNTQRGFRHFRLQAQEEGGSYLTLYDQPIVLPYAPDSRELDRCVSLRPVRARRFRAEFVQDGGGSFSGPRVLELDAIGLAPAIFADGFEPTPPTP